MKTNEKLAFQVVDNKFDIKTCNFDIKENTDKIEALNSKFIDFVVEYIPIINSLKDKVKKLEELTNKGEQNENK